MKKLLFILSCVAPLALFANDANVETDILERTVNFLIFISIFYYLLAEKVKIFFANRTNSIQAELDKVQDILKASETKINNAKNELEDSKKLANEIVELATLDISSIKTSIEENIKQEIAHLSKGFDDKTELETKKVKTMVVNEILEELLSSDNIAISQDDLVNIVIKKVA